MKYASIASERTHDPIGFMCRVLDVSTSGFFAWQARQRAPRRDLDAPLREAIVRVHQESRRRYGCRRVTHALRAQGWGVNVKRVRRVMRENGLRGVRKGRFVPRTTDECPSARPRPPRPAEALWRRDHRTGPNEQHHGPGPSRRRTVPGGDHRLEKTRRGLGYSLSDRMPDELVLNALRNACHQETPSRGTLFHPDRGGQDVRDDFRRALDALGMVASMSRKGDCWDNAVTESFFATLKAEEATEPYATKQEAHRAIAEYIHGFYNPVRLHSSLGYWSPNEYAQRLQHVDPDPPKRSVA